MTRRLLRRTQLALRCCCFLLVACSPAALLLWPRQTASPAASRPELPDECWRVISGESDAIRAAVDASKRRRLPDDYETDEALAAYDCGRLLRGFWTSGVSRDEENFPIAFTVVAHKSLYQVVKLLQAVHRRHNAYCLHVDANSTAGFRLAARRLAGCLGNVALAEAPVAWGTFSVLEADVTCMRRLLELHSTWRYVINLTGQEFPIRTLKEMTLILKLMNGANHVEKLKTSRYPKQYPPVGDRRLSGLRWYKGAVHAVLSRPAAVYIAHDRRASLIYEHIRRHAGDGGMTVPDETFYATLNHNYEVLQFPGSYLGQEFTTDTVYRQIFRYKLWNSKCLSGLSVRGVCILGVADLQQLDRSPHLIANKFYFDHESEAYRCFQARFWANTRADYYGNASKTFQVPLQFYRDLEFVRHHA